ncbi:MAG: hypothetical protein IPM25_05925 [Chloracidobacterium sp.]|nr:hypothetical protein [Chloracidobacterium sp.]
MGRKKRSIVTTIAPETDAKKKTRFQDKFQENVGHKVEEIGKTIGGHKRNLLYGLGIAVVVAASVIAYFVWTARNEAAGQLALARAIEYHDAVVSNNPTPTGSVRKQFRTATERAQAAIPEFQLVAEQYGGHIAQKAKYFIAVNQLTLDRAVGIAELEALAGSDDHVGKLAKFTLAQTRIDDGRLDEAATLLTELANASDAVVSKDSVNFELAKVYEKQGKTQEAVNILFEIAKAAAEAKDADGKPLPPGPVSQAAKDKLQKLDPAKAKEIPEAAPTPDPNLINIP